MILIRLLVLVVIVIAILIVATAVTAVHRNSHVEFVATVVVAAATAAQ